MARTHTRFIFVMALSLVLISAATAAQAGGRGGGKGGKGGKTGAGSSITLVMVDPADTVVNHGDKVTFDVSTTATDRPYVDLNCYQGGVMVYWASTGYFADYPWPWTQVFTLTSNYWTGGEGDCTATLYSTTDGIRRKIVATLDFHAAA